LPQVDELAAIPAYAQGEQLHGRRLQPRGVGLFAANGTVALLASSGEVSAVDAASARQRSAASGRFDIGACSVTPARVCDRLRHLASGRRRAA